MKPICVPCQQFYRCIKTGIYFTEAMPAGSNRPKPGKAEPENWKPYKIWSGDKWRCNGCGSEIISGVAHSPVSIQHEPDFAKDARALGADQFQVNDC